MNISVHPVLAMVKIGMAEAAAGFSQGKSNPNGSVIAWAPLGAYLCMDAWHITGVLWGNHMAVSTPHFSTAEMVY